MSTPHPDDYEAYITYYANIVGLPREPMEGEELHQAMRDRAELTEDHNRV